MGCIYLPSCLVHQYPGLLPPGLDYSVQPLSSTSCFLPPQTDTGPRHTGFLVSFEAAHAAFPRHSRAHSLVHWVAQIIEGTTEKRMEARSFSPRSCSGTYEGSVLCRWTGLCPPPRFCGGTHEGSVLLRCSPRTLSLS